MLKAEPKIIAISGTDTDIGKTVTTAALLRALRQNGVLAQAIKIVQTGVDDPNAGDAKVYVEACRGLGKMALPEAKVLRAFKMPASPHLAAGCEDSHLDLNELYLELRTYWENCPAEVLLLETAGGLFVPLNAKEDIIDLLKRLQCEIILCAANKLGAINHTLLSCQALNAAGLNLLALVITEPQAQSADEVSRLIAADNIALLTKRLGAKNTPCLHLPHLDLSQPEGFKRAAEYLAPLAAKISARQEEEDIVALDQKLLWHPYTRANQPGPLYPAQTAFENKIVLQDGRILIDGMSSWWCAIHGYNHPHLVEAIKHQAGKLAHIMFGGFTHEPAVKLGSRLLGYLPKGLSKIFFADSGSVAVEVAMKMAIQYQYGIGAKERQHFVTPYGGYHGDTFGAMSVCDPINGMHHLFNDCLAKQLFIPKPQARFDQPFAPSSLDQAKEIFSQHGHEIAALILEPIVQGAGGMWFYHPQYLQGLVDLAHQAGCLVIFDEIATGFGHTGRFFASEWANLTPDIFCLGKALTGGMLTLAATACTEEVALGISSHNQVFMHGPTFMANPLACAAALASLDLMDLGEWPDQVADISKTMQGYLAPCARLDSVQDVRVLGDIGVVETKAPVRTDFLVPYFVKKGVWIRPFNNLVYIMPPYISPRSDIILLCQAIYEGLVEHERLL